MDKEKIIRNVLAKLSSRVSPRDLNHLILTLSKSTDEEFIYKVLYRTLKKDRLTEQDIKDVFERLVKKEELHKKSEGHNKAFKRLLDGEFSFVNLSV